MQFSTEEKAMWVEDWLGSGKSAWAYAKENGLNPRTFVTWSKASPEAKMSFVEVPVPMLPPARQASEILIEKGDVKIHIPLALGSNELRTVMEGIGGAL